MELIGIKSVVQFGYTVRFLRFERNIIHYRGYFQIAKTELNAAVKSFNFMH